MVGIGGAVNESEPEEDTPPKPSIPTVTAVRDAPTVYADAAWHAANLGGNVRIQFVENQYEPVNGSQPEGWTARHVGTLVMPRIGFKSMMAYFKTLEEFFDEQDAIFDAGQKQSDG